MNNNSFSEYAWSIFNRSIEDYHITDDVDAAKYPTVVPQPRTPVTGSSVLESVLNYGLDLRSIPIPMSS